MIRLKRKKRIYPSLFNVGLKVSSYLGVIISVVLLCMEGRSVFYRGYMMYFMPLWFILSLYYFLGFDKK